MSISRIHQATIPSRHPTAAYASGMLNAATGPCTEQLIHRGRAAGWLLVPGPESD